MRWKAVSLTLAAALAATPASAHLKTKTVEAAVGERDAELRLPCLRTQMDMTDGPTGREYPAGRWGVVVSTLKSKPGGVTCTDLWERAARWIEARVAYFKETEKGWALCPSGTPWGYRRTFTNYSAGSSVPVAMSYSRTPCGSGTYKVGVQTRVKSSDGYWYGYVTDSFSHDF